MSTSVDQLSKLAANLPPNPHAKTTETFECPFLPSEDGASWGRKVTIKKLSPVEQLVLVGRVADSAAAMERLNEEGFGDDFTLPEISNPEQAANFQESALLLQMGCVDPVFSFQDAALAMSVNEKDGIPWGDLAQFLLVRIRNLHERAPGLEDVGHGLAILRRFPLTLQMLEQAFMAGPDEAGKSRVQKLLEGDGEEAAFISRWGGIISTVAFEVLRKQARVQADEASEAMLHKLVELAESLFQPQDEQDKGEG